MFTKIPLLRIMNEKNRKELLSYLLHLELCEQ